MQYQAPNTGSNPRKSISYAHLLIHKEVKVFGDIGLTIITRGLSYSYKDISPRKGVVVNDIYKIHVEVSKVNNKIPQSQSVNLDYTKLDGIVNKIKP